MPRRLQLVLVGACCLIFGLAAGLLLARDLRSDWFEAFGTWVGALVSAGAVVLAVLVFRSEDFMRRMDAARDTQREEALAHAEDLREKLVAESIFCSVSFASGNQYPDRWIARHVHISVQNNTDNRTITDVAIRYPSLYGDGWRPLSVSLRPGEQYASMEALPEPFEMKPTQDDLVGCAEFRYRVSGKMWVRRNGEPI